MSVADPMLDATVNAVGTVNVLEAARAAGSRKVVYAASGGTIYGAVDPRDLPVKESHPQVPLSPYGVSKKVGHDYLTAYRDLHQLEFTVPRARERVRPASGSARRGGRRVDLRGRAAVRAAVHDLRHR